jgi:hypothetical protein
LQERVEFEVGYQSIYPFSVFMFVCFFGRISSAGISTRRELSRILSDSKIKKKLFYLLIANIVLMGHYTNLRDFERRVIKKTNLIARRPHLFSHPNAIIYLISFFLNIFLPT